MANCVGETTPLRLACSLSRSLVGKHSSVPDRYKPRHRVKCAAITGTGQKTVPDQEVRLAKDDLLGAIATSERGVRRDATTKQSVLRPLAVLEEAGKGTVTTDSRLNACWRLLWTTEKETLFILERAHWFRTQAGDVLQQINVEERLLYNTIEFPPSGSFQIRAPIEIASPQRVNFRFQTAQLRTAKRTFWLPPVGVGWFDNVYLDEDIRVSKDSRADILVSARCKQRTLAPHANRRARKHVYLW